MKEEACYKYEPSRAQRDDETSAEYARFRAAEFRASLKPYQQAWFDRAEGRWLGPITGGAAKQPDLVQILTQVKSVQEALEWKNASYVGSTTSLRGRQPPFTLLCALVEEYNKLCIRLSEEDIFAVFSADDSRGRKSDRSLEDTTAVDNQLNASHNEAAFREWARNVSEDVAVAAGLHVNPLRTDRAAIEEVDERRRRGDYSRAKGSSSLGVSVQNWGDWADRTLDLSSSGGGTQH